MSKDIFCRDKAIFNHFKTISQIPHESGNEKDLSNWVRDFASNLGLSTYQDEMWNLIVKKPASYGYENSSPIILQSHLDMVCVKKHGSMHNFAVDELKLIENDGWLSAVDTTLGADDGCGVAYMLAVLEDRTLQHPPLECVFTVQEETGMAGARNLDYAQLSSKRMIGLDATGEHISLVSCAGGLRLRATKKFSAQLGLGEYWHLTLHLEQQGHISVKGAKAQNINMMITHIFSKLLDLKVGISLSYLKALQSEGLAEAVFYCPKEQHSQVESVLNQYRKENWSLSFSHSLDEVGEKTSSQNQSYEIIDFLNRLPNGVSAVDPPSTGVGAVSGSINRVEINPEMAVVEIVLRSPNNPSESKLLELVKKLCTAYRFDCESIGGHPPVPYKAKSSLRELLKDTMREVWGRELEEKVGQGGNEGGHFLQNIPTLEIVNLGPYMEGIHTPSERLDLHSFMKVYEFLVNFLSRLR